jgi:hypothetical protein
MIMYIAVLLGVVIYLLLQLNEVFNVKGFKWSAWFRLNVIPTVLNLITGAAIVYLKDSVTLFEITPFTALFVGYGGLSLFKKLSGVFDRNIDTVVGLNS